MNLHEKRDDAVSPVIGVMLMLVVTIVIAAVVVTFGTGMAGDATATTPMALYEVDNIIMKGDYLGTFDLVHKGGDEMNLENLKVVLEPIGKEISGSIILVRTGTQIKTNDIPDDIDQYLLDNIGDNRITVTLGEIQQLSSPGNTGDNIVLSTGDRIRVAANYEPGLTLYYQDELCYEWGYPQGYMETVQLTDATTGKAIKGKDGSFDDIPSGNLVKWTLSDTRTNGVIAKGEFVVPEP